MSCGGCSGAVERVLKRLDGQSQLSLYFVSLFSFLFFLVEKKRGGKNESVLLPPPPFSSTSKYNPIFFLDISKKKTLGVKSYNVDLAAQTAEVNADEGLTYEAVLEKIKKTGKKVNAGTADGEERSV